MQNQRSKKTNKTTLLIIGIAAIVVAAVCAFLIGTRVAPKNQEQAPAQQQEQIPEFVAEEYDQTGTCGLELQWGFREDTGKLTIIGTGKMDDYALVYDEEAKKAFLSAPWGQMDVREVAVYGAENIGQYAFFRFLNLSCAQIGSSVKTIGESAFYSCSNLTELNLADGVTTIAREAFGECSALRELKIPDSAETIGSMAFMGCSNLSNIALGNGIKVIEDAAFCQCNNVTEITIPASTENIVSQSTFLCKNLQNFHVDESNPNYCDVDGVLFDKNKTTLLQYPAGRTDASYAIPSGVQTIRENAFNFCENLNEILLPDTLQTLETSVFSYCTKLTSLEFPNSVTMLPDYLFLGCESLSSVKIPASVTELGGCVFDLCHNLTDIYYGGSQADWNLIYMGPYNYQVEDATIHYNQ